ncbi:MAG TPA: response regulator transcription factor [Chloroflexota bacterium]|nr:response regulator transcription factor [Chloroflexota bacterium]
MSESNRPHGAATIVIIEDDDRTASDLQAGLVGAGYVVRRAGSADEALTTLEQTRADLILMSLMLPDTDGLILCSTLKTQFRAPIIVLSARGGEVDRALALESGAIDLVPKPVDVDELLTQVRAVVTQGLGVSAGDQWSGFTGQRP